MKLRAALVGTTLLSAAIVTGTSISQWNLDKPPSVTVAALLSGVLPWIPWAAWLVVTRVERLKLGNVEAVLVQRTVKYLSATQKLGELVDNLNGNEGSLSPEDRERLGPVVAEAEVFAVVVEQLSGGMRKDERERHEHELAKLLTLIGRYNAWDKNRASLQKAAHLLRKASQYHATYLSELSLGWVLLRLGRDERGEPNDWARIEEARERLRLATRYADKPIGAWYNFGLCCSDLRKLEGDAGRRRELLDQEKSAYEQALKYDKNKWEAQYNLAYVQAEREESAAAMDALIRAFEIDSKAARDELAKPEDAELFRRLRSNLPQGDRNRLDGFLRAHESSLTDEG